MHEADIQSLIHGLLEGDCAGSVAHAEALRGAGVRAEKIVLDGVEAAMNRLDAKCTLEQFNLLEIMLVGRAVMEVMKVLYPPGSAPAGTKGTVVIAALEGDVHDLGKNILKMVLTAKGYRVVDCGKDCSLGTLADAAVKETPLAVGVSGLITTIIPLVKQVRDTLRRRGLGEVKVLAGGAALKQAIPAHLNVDYVAESAFDGVGYLDGLSGGLP
ncbi:MAG: cobalamin-dependent protein [Deltaproteobacteria bacterium]|nr:cobalamin-dependent protein [Deltaproteobacteria bacterium]